MISSVVVDTDVVSFIFKNDSRGVLYTPHITGRIALVSFMTVAELRRWYLQRNWGNARQQELEDFLQNYIVIHSEDSLCTKWAEVTSNAARKGRPIDTADAWNAATAILHNVPLVTHNGKHYAGVDGLTIISEATP